MPTTTERCEYCGAVLKSNRPLTKKQVALYRYLAEYIRSEGCAPSFAEIAEHFGYQSFATVHEHLIALEWKGWIRREFNQPRSIELLVSAEDAA